MEKNGPMEKQFAYEKTIRLWKNDLIMEKQFNYGKTIRLWKNNSIMEKQFDNGTKFDLENKLIWKSNFHFQL